MGKRENNSDRHCMQRGYLFRHSTLDGCWQDSNLPPRLEDCVLMK